MPSVPFILTRQSHFQRGNRLSVRRMPHQAPMQQHRHEFFEIAIVLSGTGTHVTGNYRHLLEAGDVLVLNPRRTHGYENCRSLNLINLLVRDDMLNRIGRALGDQPGYHALFRVESPRWKQTEFSSRLHLTTTELERVEDWVVRMEEETRLGARAVRLLQEACLALIVDLLCHQYERHHAPSRSSLRSDSTFRLGHLLSWIEKNLDRPLRRSDLAEQAGMSTRTFHRVFRHMMKTTPQAYLAQARMRRAQEMLADETLELPITEIALACGFSDSNYFTRCFHRTTGQRPSAYRKSTIRKNHRQEPFRLR